MPLLFWRWPRGFESVAILPGLAANGFFVYQHPRRRACLNRVAALVNRNPRSKKKERFDVDQDRRFLLVEEQGSQELNPQNKGVNTIRRSETNSGEEPPLLLHALWGKKV
jgi:hypothetical protein